MELEEIKKLWQDMDTPKAQKQITDDSIRRILQQEGKSALDKLIRTARVYTIIMIPLGLFLCLCSHQFFTAGGFYMVWPLLFLLICIALEPYEIYLYRLLKSIDYSTMSVKEVSARILKYQHHISRWQPYGLGMYVVYLTVWYFLYYKILFGNGDIQWFFIIIMGSLLLGGLIVIPILFKKLYFQHIDTIKKNLIELEEFEE